MEKQSIKCQLECGMDAKLFCPECKNIQYFCQECYLLSHKAAAKASHKPVDNFSDIEKSRFCKDHLNSAKIIVCLDCNKAVCKECLASTTHDGHKFGDFSVGFTKVVKESKSLIDNCTKITGNHDKYVENLVDQGITKLKEMYKKIQSSFAEFRKNVDKKEKEMLEAVEVALNERSKLKEDIGSLQGKLNKILSELKTLMDKGCTQGSLDFDLMLRKTEQLKELEKSDAEITKMKGKESGKYEPPSMDEASKALNELKITQSMISDKPKAPPMDSLILKDEEQIAMLAKWITEAYPKDKQKISFELLYRGTRDGFDAAAFHNKCNNKSPTVTIGQSSKGNIFGGCTSIIWGTHNGWTSDNKAFIFSITHKTKHDKQKNQNSVYDDSSNGPIFGSGCDADFSKENNYNTSGNSTYELPPGVDNNTYLTGENPFKPVEIEVFAVKNK